MGLYAEIIDHDEVFHNLDFEAVVVNDYNTSIPEEKEALDRQLYTHYQNTDTIEEAASCECGTVTGMYNLGIVCDTCNSPVQGTTDKPIQSILWLRAPKGVVSLINPAAWMVLEPAMSSKELNVLEYMTNTGYHVDPNTIKSKETKKKALKLIEALRAHGIRRGYNSFIQNFDMIMEILFTQRIVDTNTANRNELWEFIQKYKHRFFPQHIPLPSKVCFVIESTTSGIYIDKPLGAAMNAIQTMASIRSTGYPLKPAVVQNRVAKTIKQLTAFYDEFTKRRLSQKPGMFRRHVLGSRLHLTGRAVITSISDPHMYDELHLPWGMAVQLFKYHIINKLMKMGQTANQALNHVYGSVLKHDSTIERIFDELINKSPYGAPRACFHRN